MEITVGYCGDTLGQATRKYQIVDETISGKFVCKGMPWLNRRPDGSQYIANSITGLFLKDKSEFSNIHTENLEVE